MKTQIRTLVAGAVLLTLLFVPGTARAEDAQMCQPGIVEAYSGRHTVQYQTLINTLIPAAGQLITNLRETLAAANETTYQALLAEAMTVKNSIPNGRILISSPDGTVILDTSKNNNSWANYLAKAINENHNSRVAILAAQQYPCGYALESKLSSTTGLNEAYFALRAGDHLDSVGTIRISQVQ